MRDNNLNYDKETAYNETLNFMVSYLCGVSCGMAIDSILEYVKQPDCSQAQLDRLILELNTRYGSK
jgi:hypothetical protein